MGFKLGKERGNYAINGEIKTKMRFGKDSGGDASVPGTPIIRHDISRWRMERSGRSRFSLGSRCK